MYLKLAAALAALLLFCSCGSVSLSGTESLLVAPKLNKDQENVAQAFDATLSMRSIAYKPPQSGEHRSPVIFYDIDGDGLREAIVFYAFSGSDSDSGTARVAVLKEASGGKWGLFYDVSSPTQGSEIEFVKFEKLLSTQSSCVIIGWKAAAMNKPSTLAVYSIKDNAFPIEAASDYLNYLIEDFDRDGLAEIAIVGHDSTRGRFRLGLWRGRIGRFEEVDGIELASDVGAPVSMTTGLLWDGYRGIYIDELLSGGAVTYATEIARVSLTGLTLLSGGEAVSRGEPENSARSNYESTFRDDDVFCSDIDGDGTVEIPNPVTLPSPFDISGTESPKLIQFMRLASDGFEAARSAVINAHAGYLVYFPKRWIDSVTVETERETGEWYFRKWNEDSQSAAEELLRVRVVSRAIGPDVFSGDYVELARKGTVVYSAYIPALQNEALQVTEQEVREMFRLI